MTETILLVVVVMTALAFDFTNGFHDTGNAMATSIATRALKPKTAVLLSASLNMVGAFLSLTVAATIATGIVDAGLVTLEVVLAGLVGGILWNLITWLFGIPSSSSHALIGGIVGAMLAAAGTEGVLWGGLVAKVMLPALLAPIVAIAVASIGTALVARLTRDVPQDMNEKSFRWGQIGSASLVSLAHGTNDAQKSMGIILLALIAAGAVPEDSGVPFWVIFSCALAMALGTYLGGWRVIRTLGKGLVEIDSRQGMAAETSSAAVILLSSHFGFSLSTTHVATGSILGSGVGMKGADVRWGVAGRMGLAWLITVPAAGIVGALAYWIQGVVGGDAGAFVSFGLLILISAGIYLVSRRKPVNHTNVNDEWEPSRTGGSDETATDGELTGDSYEYDPEAIDVLADAVVMRDVYALSSESDTDEPDPTTSENRA
ncbi:inorganic phosphate transporter, PiT family [Paraoerskovia marina]|uniref:Phosphate transporter n=1 Tax=Paraoerskovia marina TaxID=545619 RepID=A0A1H1NPP0_9CELL|nr:inorganic phosphate transporter [Paraoerskovia marina]SDS00873.1 inorganic phosphate transporter, PiT family [Paraoerskovia marina]